jgi:hypothetical protein
VNAQWENDYLFTGDEAGSELNEWQAAEINKGLIEADRGEFASETELDQTLKRWRVRLTASRIPSLFPLPSSAFPHRRDVKSLEQ